MHDPEHAVEEIEYAFDTLKLDGACFLSNYDGQYLGKKKFEPVLAALDARGAPVFIHPYHAGPHLPGAPPQTVHLPYPSFIMEYPFDTTRLAAHLMFSGALDKFSKINFILPHAGGTLPFLAWRLSIAHTFGDYAPDWSFEELRTRLKRFWYDTAMSGGHEMLTCLKSVVGLDRVVYGSDWPMACEQAVGLARTNLTAPDFMTAAEQAAVNRDNVLNILPSFKNS
jgi:predicted TIM-barrel fold metal-dependent hydrolase